LSKAGCFASCDALPGVSSLAALRAWKEGLLLAVDVAEQHGEPCRSPAPPPPPLAAAAAASASTLFRVPKRERVEWPSDAGASPLFDATSRNDFDSASRVSESAFDEARRLERIAAMTLPAPGALAAKAPATAPVVAGTGPSSQATFPVVLVRKRDGGFDVVLPASRASRLFNRFVKAGAAPVGLDEVDALLHRRGLPSFPRDYPETKAGVLFWQARKADWAARDEARPPSKRLGALRWRVFDPLLPPTAVLGFVVPRRRIYMNALITEHHAALPFPTLLPVTVVALGRGVLHDGAALFLLPPAADCAPDSSANDDDDAEVGRVTSGYCRRNGGKGGATRFGFAVIQADAFRTAISQQQLVHFRNPASSVLRVARLSLCPSSD